MKTISFTYTPEEELVYAVESLASMLTSTLDAVNQTRVRLIAALPGLKRGFSGNTDLTTLGKFAAGIPAHQTVLLKNIAHVTYGEIRNIGVTVPEGMIGTYLNFLKALRPAVEHIRDIVPDVVMPYTVFLASLVSNKSAALSTKGGGIDFNKMERERNASYAALGACFNKTTNVRSSMGEVIERNSDWALVLKETKELSDIINQIKREQVREFTRQCEDYLDAIYHNLQNGAIEEVSPEAANALALGAYQVASELTYFSVVYYRTLSLASAINHSVDQLNYVLE